MKFLFLIGILIFIIVCIIFVFYVYFYLTSMMIIHKNIIKERKLILPHNKYIYFNHKGSEGIGIIYNKNEDKNNPNYWVNCIFNDQSTQHLRLNELDNYKFIDKNESTTRIRK